jgi:hypothetical protein
VLTFCSRPELRSSRGIFPPLFAFLHHFVQIRSWSYFPRPKLQTRMPRNELNGMIQASRLEH